LENDSLLSFESSLFRCAERVFMRLLSEGYLVVFHTALTRRFSLIRERMWAGRFKENGGMGLVGGVEFFAAD